MTATQSCIFLLSHCAHVNSHCYTQAKMGCQLAVKVRESDENTASYDEIQRYASQNRCIPTPEDAKNAEQIYRDWRIQIVPDLSCPNNNVDCIVNSGNTIAPIRNIPDICVPANRNVLVYNDLFNQSSACRGVRRIPGVSLYSKIKDVKTDAPIYSSRRLAVVGTTELCNSFIGNEWEASQDFIHKVAYPAFERGPWWTGGDLNPNYNNKYIGTGSGCRNSGYNPYCQRKSNGGYSGNALPCCLREWPNNVWGLNREPTSEYPPTQNHDNCFQVDLTTGNTDRSKTCPPLTANPTTPICSDAIASYCAGDITLDGEPQPYSTIDLSWVDERWLQPNALFSGRSICQAQVDRYLAIPGSVSNFNVSNIFERLIDKLRQSGRGVNDASNTTTATSARIWGLLESYCGSYPGLCDSALTNYCQDFTYADLINDAPLTRLCGCFLPDAQYNSYETNVSIPVECAPLCNAPGTIRRGDISSGQWRNCERTVCVIDDVTVNSINSNLQLDISQTCGGCGVQPNGVSTGCTCIMSNLDFTVVNSNIRAQIDQNCSSTSCYSTEDGNIDCESGQQLNTRTDNLTTASSQPVVTRTQLIVGVVVVIIIVLLITLLVIRYLLR